MAPSPIVDLIVELVLQIVDDLVQGGEALVYGPGA